ncbi:MAG TPA: hypothetical protein VM871_01025, partial [Flavisolibacter sp.]|nr:hypothetical protein [Flavisolibacter sp.]
DTDLQIPNADQYVTWRANNTNGSLTSPADSLDFYRMGNNTAVYGMSQPVRSNYFELSFDGPQQNGNYTATNFVVVAGGKHYYPASTPVQVMVTSYGSAGKYIVGTYTGNATDSASLSVVPVSGAFRIKNN